MNLWDAWHALWPDAPRSERIAVAGRLCDQYAEPHRHYHRLDHVDACLAVFERLCPATAEIDRDVVRVALWFHDCFHDVRAVDNEWRSATSAGNVCRHLGRPELIDRVRACILATKHDGRDLSSEARYVVDADLSILGADPEAFDLYETQIRAEYPHVDEETFRKGRAAILGRFANGVYRTRAFQDALEERAQANLRRSAAK